MSGLDRRHNSDVVVETLCPLGKRVIDVGCGDGSLVRLMAERGADVLGIECSPRQLARARTRPNLASAEIVEGIAQKLPVASSSADAVVFFNSLHHIPVPDMAAALAEAARALKPGGLVYISEPLPEGPFFGVCRPIDDETIVRAAALETIRTADRCGLKADSEFRYLHTIRMESYETFRDKVISANAEREALFERMDTQMRQLFASAARTDGEGRFLFDQPMRVNLLRKPMA